ncbi:MAG: hypothetical protein QM500_21505 [Methylococcales bacterium]
MNIPNQTTLLPATDKEKKLNRLFLFLLALYFIIFNTIFIHGKLPKLPLPGGADLHLSDMLLGAMFVIGLSVKFRHSGSSIKTPLSKFLILFVFVLFIVVFYSIGILHQPLTTTLATFRDFYSYMLFFPVIWVLGSNAGVKAVIKLWAWLTVFGVLLYLAQFFIGEFSIMKNTEWLFSTSREVSVVGGLATSGERFTRIFSAGTVLFRIMLFVAICMWLFSNDKQRWWWGALAALIGFQVLLQFTRGMYISTIAVLIMIPFLVNDSTARSRLYRLYAVVFALAGMLVVYKIAIHSGDSGGLFAFAKERLLRAFGDVHEDVSLEGRFQAWDYFMVELSGYWSLGLGMGRVIVYGDNTYLSLLIKTGVMGLSAFLLFFSVTILRGYFSFKYVTDTYMKAVYLGLWLSTLRHLVNGITQSDFAIGTRIPALIISVALMEIILYNARKETAIKVEGDMEDTTCVKIPATIIGERRILAKKRSVNIIK